MLWWEILVLKMSSKPNNQGPSMAAQRHIPRNRDSVGSLPHHLKSIRTRPAERRDDAGDKQQFRSRRRLTTSFSSFTYNSSKCYGMNWKGSSEVGREGHALFYPKSSREEPRGPSGHWSTVSDPAGQLQEDTTQEEASGPSPPPGNSHGQPREVYLCTYNKGFFKCQEKF